MAENTLKANQDLSVVTPEEVGVPAKAVERYLDWLEAQRLPMHSVIMARHGKIFLEAYWDPFTPDRKHRLYSTSKSFVSVSIGLLEAEGKLHLDDCIADYFKDKWPEELPRQIARCTIRDCLRMSTMQYGTSYSWEMMDWAKSFFHTDVCHYPGQIFRYDTSATTIMNILVSRLSGMEFTSYLKEKLFRPANMSDDIWCVETPCGHEWGGSGMQATARDMLKFGLICMDGGRWNGRQLLPEKYIREATSYQIDNRVAGSDMEEQQGYGYQFWRLPWNGFACLGMGNQIICCWPDQDFVMVMQGDTQRQGGAYQNVWHGLEFLIMPELNKNTENLPENAADNAALQKKIAGLTLNMAEGDVHSDMEAVVSGKTFQMTENAMGITSMRFTFEGDEGTMEWENARGSHLLHFGLQKQVQDRFPEKIFSGRRIRVPKVDGYECHTSAGWVQKDSLLLYCYLTDWYFGSLRVQATFEEESVTVFMDKNAEDFLTDYVGFASGFTEGNDPWTKGGCLHA